MKRFTVIALTLVMSFSMLTACSSSEEDSDDIDEVPPEYREENGPEEEGSGAEESSDTDGDSDDGNLNSKVNMTGPEQMPDDDGEESSTEQ